MSRGMTLVEVVIAAAIISASVLALLLVHSLYIKTALANTSQVKAIFLAEEGVEDIRFLRDSSWSANIANLSATTTTIDSFTRTVTLSDAYRDSNSDIVASGTPDSNTKLITSSVSWWNGTATSTKSISAYITNLYAN